MAGHHPSVRNIANQYGHAGDAVSSFKSSTQHKIVRTAHARLGEKGISRPSHGMFNAKIHGQGTRSRQSRFRRETDARRQEMSLWKMRPSFANKSSVSFASLSSKMFIVVSLFHLPSGCSSLNDLLLMFTLDS
jgi:hypothetical protein